jgi:hypothetical protein
MDESQLSNPPQSARASTNGSRMASSRHSLKPSEGKENSIHSRVPSVHQTAPPKKTTRNSLHISHHFKDESYSRMHQSFDAIDPRLRSWHVLERERIRRLHLPVDQVNRTHILHLHPLTASQSPRGNFTARMLGRSPLTGENSNKSRSVGAYAHGEGLPETAATVEYNTQQPMSPRTMAKNFHKMKLDVPYADVYKWRSQASAPPTRSA